MSSEFKNKNRSSTFSLTVAAMKLGGEWGATSYSHFIDFVDHMKI